jgi:hypothetical protein
MTAYDDLLAAADAAQKAAKATQTAALDAQNKTQTVYTLIKNNPPVTPPDPTPVPPDPTPPSGGTPFQTLWDATKMQAPGHPWNAVKAITSQSALDSWLGSRQANDHVTVKGFTYNGRLEIRGGGPFWMECDSTFQVVNKGQGSSYIGMWVISTNGATITGFPVCHDCGNTGLQAEAAQNCYLEIETRDNGGTGLMIKPIGNTGTPTGGTFKIKGGNNGRGCMPPGSPGYEAAFYSPDIDPHAQKGTGSHFANAWYMPAGSTIVLDITKEQKFGAGFETTGFVGTSAKPITVGVRATSLACDVNTLPPAPGGGRQAGGNLWQPWGDAHSYVICKALEAGSCARGVEALGSYSNCKVESGAVKIARLSPCWPTVSGITYGTVTPKP